MRPGQADGGGLACAHHHGRAALRQPLRRAPPARSRAARDRPRLLRGCAARRDGRYVHRAARWRLPRRHRPPSPQARRLRLRFPTVEPRAARGGGLDLAGRGAPPRARQPIYNPLQPPKPVPDPSTSQVNKWVAISPARVRSIRARRPGNGNASLEVELRGAPGELVALAFAPPATALHVHQLAASRWRPTVVECYVPPGGAVRVIVPERTCH